MDKKILLMVSLSVAFIFGFMFWIDALTGVAILFNYDIDTSRSMSKQYLNHLRVICTVALCVYSLLFVFVIIAVLIKTKKLQKTIKTIFITLSVACLVVLIVLVCVSKVNMPIQNLDSFPPRVDYMDYAYFETVIGASIGYAGFGALLIVLSVLYVIFDRKQKQK